MKTCADERGFTLVELLAAMAVFVLMAVFVAQLTSATQRSAQISVRAVDASSQARLALDRIGLDLAGVLRRQDCVFAAGNPGGNRLLFLSQVSSASDPGWTAGDNRSLSAVAYQIAPSASNQNRPCLLRAGRALRWSDRSFMGLDASGYPLPIPASLIPRNSDFDMVSPGVICLAVGFQLYPDNLPVTLANATVIANSQGQLVYSAPVRSDTGSNPYVDLSRVSAVLVALVSVDLDSLKLLNAGQVADLAAAFPAPTARNVLPSQTWTPIANLPASLPLSVPLPARQGVRVAQRFYPVAPYGRN